MPSMTLVYSVLIGGVCEERHTEPDQFHDFATVPPEDSNSGPGFVAAPIAPSLHPASRRYSATMRALFRVIGLFLAIAFISARVAARSLSQSSRLGASVTKEVGLSCRCRYRCGLISMLRGCAAWRRRKDGQQARRLLALAAIYDGATRSASRPALTPCSWPIRPAGTCRRGSSFLQMPPSSPCRRNVPRSTRWKTSATIGCQTASSTPTTISSTIAAKLGTGLPISPGGSCPSDCDSGPMGSHQGELV
jgi:hypothetical protein